MLAVFAWLKACRSICRCATLEGMPGDDVIDRRRRNPAKQRLEKTGLYHSFRLPDGSLLEGTIDINHLEERLASFALPEDLRGKRVLDIGPWDGYFTFEMERRGAGVVAIDYADLDTFRELHSFFQSHAQYLNLDVYELDPLKHGTFDIVLFLGVLYHLKHPLLALERVCAVTRELCILDTFVVDAADWRAGVRPSLPYMEFYERDELGGQLDNWTGPTVSAVEALVRAAGFAQAKVLKVSDTTARVAAYRVWQDLPGDLEPPVKLLDLSSHQHRGHCFHSHREEYVMLWVAWQSASAPPLHLVYPRIDGLGVAPLTAAITEDGLQVNFRVPPGLLPGRHQVRLKIGCSQWSEPREFYLDLPATQNELRMIGLQDGVTWREHEVDWAAGGWMTVWVHGLTPEADPGNTIVEISGVPHYPAAVDVSKGQINVQLRPVIHPGQHAVRVLHRGATTELRRVEVKGEAAPIRGLEPVRALSKKARR